ncbi:MAG: hypothetical protein V3U49_02500 [Nitrososphaerales archaeon]
MNKGIYSIDLKEGSKLDIYLIIDHGRAGIRIDDSGNRGVMR